VAQQTIVAHFDSRADAQKAVDALVQAGIARTSIGILPEETGSATATSSSQRSSSTSTYDRESGGGGFWSSLGDLFVPEEDRHVYAEGMSRGGVTVSVRADDAQADDVMDVIERYGAVDLDEREQAYRSSGSTGYTAGATAGATTATGTATTDSAGIGAARVRDDGVIERAEEQIRVGKRQAAGGRVRVRSYVVETPVEEQVTLRDERVHLERRPVDRPVQPGDAVFGERVIEASERSEEAVVSKEARVVEEIGLRKEADTRTETVRDTVRRQEVEVEDDRTTRGAGLTGGTTTGGTTTTVETDVTDLGTTTTDRTRTGGL
jgi:stress response protein YsnF